MKKKGAYLLFSAQLAGGLLQAATPPQLSQDRPNIIFILADDAGPDSLGCYGSESYAHATPRLDSLATNGLRFTRCFAGPMCSPARYEYLSGQYPFRNGCVASAGRYDSLNSNRPSLALLLQKAGYRTIGAGKTPNMIHSGLDEYISCGTGFYWQEGTYHLKRPENPLEKIQKPEGIYFPDQVHDYVLKRLEECAEKSDPFYLYYSLINPHGLGGEKPYTQRTPDSDPTDFTNDRALYRDNIEYIDHLVGELVDRLESLCLLDNTLILFSSDNGGVSSQQSRMLDPTTKTYRKIHGEKSDLPQNREGACLVPLLAFWPNQIKTPSVITDVVDFTDFLVTYAELAEIAIPDEWAVDGHSFAPLLKNDPAWTPRDWIFAQDGYQWYIRGADYRLNVDGHLFDMSDAPFGMTEVSPPLASLIRTQYQAVLDDFDPSAGITYEFYQDRRIQSEEWTWKTREFKNKKLWLSSTTGDLSDPDEDGIPNIFERAFGWSPSDGTDTMPTLQIDGTSLSWNHDLENPAEFSVTILKKRNSSWTLSLPKIENDCVRILVESSSDKRTWNCVSESKQVSHTFSERVDKDIMHLRIRAERTTLPF